MRGVWCGICGKISVGLGHRRPAIIDLSEDGSNGILFIFVLLDFKD